jgi:hypothetical protein
MILLLATIYSTQATPAAAGPSVQAAPSLIMAWLLSSDAPAAAAAAAHSHSSYETSDPFAQDGP